MTDNKLKPAIRLAGIISIFGALGGFVVGITRHSSYSLQLPFYTDKTLEIGIFGDLLVGGLTSIAAFYFLGSLLGISEKEYDKTSDWIKLISVSLLAGFAGIGLMSTLSSDLLGKLTNVEQVVSQVDTVVNQVDSNVTAVRNLSESSIQILSGLEKFNEGEMLRAEIKEHRNGERVRSRIKDCLTACENDDLKIQGFGAILRELANNGVREINISHFLEDEEACAEDVKMLFRQARKKYILAQLRFDRALDKDPENVKAMVELARVHEKFAWLYKQPDAPDWDSEMEGSFDSKEETEMAIRILGKVIDIDGQHARAYYNRACYYSILNDPTSALVNLKEAITLKKQYREYCQVDSDFANIRQDRGYAQLLKSRQ